MKFIGNSEGPGRVIVRPTVKQRNGWSSMGSHPEGRQHGGMYAAHPFSGRLYHMRTTANRAAATSARKALGVYGPQDSRRRMGTGGRKK